jgi:hypothetical protein
MCWCVGTFCGASGCLFFAVSWSSLLHLSPCPSSPCESPLPAARASPTTDGCRYLGTCMTWFRTHPSRRNNGSRRHFAPDAQVSDAVDLSSSGTSVTWSISGPVSLHLCIPPSPRCESPPSRFCASPTAPLQL